ncbi:MAG TPA: ATP-binding cassette domain-containing protein [Planctomycetota bacterium]
MIEVSNLLKTYPGVTAVDGLTFRVEKGEVVGFLGPNGAGKTTTMRILTGFLAPTSGSASVAGFDVLTKSLEVRRRVGYLPENNPLYTEMRVEEYLRFRATVKGVERSAREKAVGAAVERVGLVERRRSIIQHLSKGLRQRVGLADAILHDPEIVILDEPTIGLDPTQVREARELVRELGRDRTVLLSSHILSEVEKVCRRVLIMGRGKLVEQGTPAEIAARMRKTTRIRLEVRAPDGAAVKRAIEEIPTVLRVMQATKEDVHQFLIEASEGADPREPLFQACVASGWGLRELAFERPTLEEAFTALTSGEARP